MHIGAFRFLFAVLFGVLTGISLTPFSSRLGLLDIS